MRNFLELQHAAEELAGFNAGCAYEDRLAFGVGFFDGLDRGVVFFAAGFVDAVVLVRSLHRAVGGNDIHIEAVDVVELAHFRLGSAGHACEFVVEAEVILDRDGREGLGLAVDLDALLGLDGLVESIAPAAAGHFAAGEGIDDDHFVFLDDIFDILFVEAVGFDELGDVVDALTLGITMLLAGGFFLQLLGSGERGVILNVGELGEEIRQHEGVRVIGIQIGAAYFREVGLVGALFDGEVEFLLERDEGCFALGVFVKFQLRLVHELAHFGILEVAEEGLAAGLAELELEKGAACLGGFTGFGEFLDLGGETVAEHGLLADELLDERLEAVVLVGRNGGRAADDERRAGFVDEDRVHFIDDGEVVPALDLLLAAGGHAIVAKVIEAELAVRAVGDIALVLLAALLRHLVILNNAHGESKKCVELSHPLRIALGEVVVDCDNMDAASREGIQVNGQRADERLALAGGHFCDAAAMKNHAADELHIEMNHVPGEGISAHYEFASTEPAGAVFHHRECLGKYRIQLGSQFAGIGNFSQPLLPLMRLRSERLIRQGLEACLDFIDLFDDRHHVAQLALIF